MDAMAFAQSITSGDEERPYRSHLQPACLECRKRKSRCIRNIEAEVCLHCAVRNVRCVLPDTKDKPKGKRSSKSTRAITESSANKQHFAKRRRQSSPSKDTRPETDMVTVDRSDGLISASNTAALPEVSEQCFNATAGILDSTEDESPHVVAPSSIDVGNALNGTLLTSISTRRPLICPVAATKKSGIGVNPVMFTTVRRRPLGHVKHQSCAAAKCEIIEKLIGPGIEELVNV